MTTTTLRHFKGGTLEVTEVPIQKCDCDEEFVLEDAALIAGYTRMLGDRSIVGKITISLNELKGTYSVQDFLPA
ncbi:hypothetical protein JI735_33755 (plasmid) [Paenibacillus sonchi]|uniref:Uncharacterized protein n=1 Tax=Paenibacillus sonchi TaxID=373687 RepID=A0A974SFH4_9BACL|nr:hypothetical protein [Paenibacillus sonchi]QQZ64618.1 hypothetical protein JI735_33755 [Paenibacillus sonchi]